MLKTVLKPHRRSLKAGDTKPQKLFAMLKVIPSVEIAGARPPLAIALVIDTSASMRMYANQEAAERMVDELRLRAATTRMDGLSFEGYDLGLPTLLEQAIQAAHQLVDAQGLAPSDTISIIHFDDEAHTLLPMTPVADKARIHHAIESMRNYAGGTYMARGLQCALQEMNRVAPSAAKRVLVLTDGEAMDEDGCRGLSSQFAAANTPVIGIGFGEEYNEALLVHLADATHGRPYHITQMSDLSFLFHAEVSQSMREVVTDLKADIAAVRGVHIDSVSRVYPALIEVNIKDSPYRCGNIAAGDFTVYIVEMTVAGVERPPSRVRLARISLTAAVPGLQRVPEIAPQDLVVEFTNDEAAVAVVDPEVVDFVQQKNVGRIINDAVKTVPSDTTRARQSLQTAAGMSQRLGNSAMTQILNDALDELDSTGKLSPATGKSVTLNTRTKTVKTQPMDTAGSTGLTPEELRKLSGT